MKWCQFPSVLSYLVFKDSSDKVHVEICIMYKVVLKYYSLNRLSRNPPISSLLRIPILIYMCCFGNRISRHPAISTLLPWSEHWWDKRVRLYVVSLEAVITPIVFKIGNWFNLCSEFNVQSKKCKSNLSILIHFNQW